MVTITATIRERKKMKIKEEKPEISCDCFSIFRREEGLNDQVGHSSPKLLALFLARRRPRPCVSSTRHSMQQLFQQPFLLILAA
ncbi:hypothetical protein Peur_042146 [Populus x canadensis]